jgi:glycosyltransferase involved in cell wall biosynthesis
MRILFIYKYLTQGGVESVLRTRIEQLPFLGIDAYAWFLGDQGGRDMFNSLEHRVFVGESAIKEDELKEYDLIVSIDTEEVIPILGNVTSIFESHSPYLENLEYLRSAEFRSLNIRKILTPSRHQAEVVQTFGIPAKRIKIIPNPIGNAFFSPSIEMPKNTWPILLWIGRLDELKNWIGFLAIVGELRNINHSFEAIMIGKISDQHGGSNRLFQELRKRSITDCVRWIESIDHARMVRLYDLVRASGGIVISTAKNESFGMTVAEAMARGCTVFAPKREPFLEYIQPNKNGYLYQESNRKNIAGRLAKIMEKDDRQRGVGMNAKKDIISHYHPTVTLGVLKSELFKSTAQ